jgi:putative transposase
LPRFGVLARAKIILWSPSYFVGSVGGARITVLREDIEQETPP